MRGAETGGNTPTFRIGERRPGIGDMKQNEPKTATQSDQKVEIDTDSFATERERRGELTKTENTTIQRNHANEWNLGE